MRQIYQHDFIKHDIQTSILVFFISIITTIGGVGGGGLLIPTYLLVGQFNLSQSVPLSILTIFGDTIVRLIYLFPKKHPLNNKRSIIDLTPLLLLIPFDGNTSFIGVILANLLPDIFRLFCIIFILGLTLIKTTFKAFDTLKKEDIFLRKLENENELEMIVIDGIANYIDKNTIEEFNNKDGLGDTLRQKYTNSFISFSCISILSIFSFIRSSYSVCSIKYYYFIFGQFLFILFYGLFIVNYLKNNYNFKKNNNYLFLEGDIVWKNNNIFKFISIGSLTGFLSTYMGIGGGMLVTPIMFNVGMIPEVVVATSSVSTFFSTIISLINYLQTPDLLWKHGLVFAFISGIGSLVGLKVSNIIIKKFKRQSIIIFIVDFILLLSMCLLIYNGSVEYNFNNFKISNVCKLL